MEMKIRLLFDAGLPREGARLPSLFVDRYMRSTLNFLKLFFGDFCSRHESKGRGVKPTTEARNGNTTTFFGVWSVVGSE